MSLPAPTERRPEASENGTDMNGGKKVTAVQGKDTPVGGVPAMNIERIYSTTVSADELA